MLNKIIRFSVQNKLIIGFFTLALVAWGVLSVKKLPIDLLLSKLKSAGKE